MSFECIECGQKYEWTVHHNAQNMEITVHTLWFSSTVPLSRSSKYNLLLNAHRAVLQQLLTARNRFDLFIQLNPHDVKGQSLVVPGHHRGKRLHQSTAFALKVVRYISVRVTFPNNNVVVRVDHALRRRRGHRGLRFRDSRSDIGTFARVQDEHLQLTLELPAALPVEVFVEIDSVVAPSVRQHNRTLQAVARKGKEEGIVFGGVSAHFVANGLDEVLKIIESDPLQWLHLVVDHRDHDVIFILGPEQTVQILSVNFGIGEVRTLFIVAAHTDDRRESRLHVVLFHSAVIWSFQRERESTCGQTDVVSG